jgi:predicted dinucleotide-binding enzyme
VLNAFTTFASGASFWSSSAAEVVCPTRGIAAAAKLADVVIFAVNYPQAGEAVREAGGFAGKVLVSASFAALAGSRDPVTTRSPFEASSRAMPAPMFPCWRDGPYS